MKRKQDAPQTPNAKKPKKQQEILEDDITEDDDPNTSTSQILSDFGEMVTSAGFNIREFKIDDVPLFKKNLHKALVNNSQLVQEFVVGFQNFMQQGRLRKCLLPLENSTFTGDSLCRVLLDVEPLQFSLAIPLLESVVENGDDEQLARLILSQFKWLNLQNNTKKIADKLLEILEGCNNDTQKMIISYIPEIIDDTQHAEIFYRLGLLMKEDSSLTIAILDALSNLNAPDDKISSAVDDILSKLNSADGESVPIMIKFLMQTASDATALHIVQKMRENLDFSSLEYNDLLETDNEPSYRRKKKKSEKGVVSFILEALKTGIRYKPSLVKAFITEISSTKRPGDHKILDVWILIIIHSMDNYRLKTERVLKKKILEGTLTSELLRLSMESRTDALYQYFSSLIILANWFLLKKEQLLEFGKMLYAQLYKVFSSDYHRQEVLGSLITHIGSGSKPEIDAALEILLSIASSHLQSLREFSGYIQGILDYLDMLKDEHLFKVYELFSILAFTRGHSDAENEERVSFRHNDIIMKILRKQLQHPNPKYKKMGLIGVTQVISNLGNVTNEMRVLEEYREQRLNTKELEIFNEILGDAFKYCAKAPICISNFFDGLCFVIFQKTRSLDKRVLRELYEKAEEVLNICIANKPVKNIQIEKINAVPKIALDSKLKKCIHILDKIQTPQAIEHIWNINSALRLLIICERKMNNEKDGLSFVSYLKMAVLAADDDTVFENCTTKEKELICLSIYLIINWFRELVSSLAYSANLKGALADRIKAILEQELLMDKYLFQFPQFVLPLYSEPSKEVRMGRKLISTTKEKKNDKEEIEEKEGDEENVDEGSKPAAKKPASARKEYNLEVTNLKFVNSLRKQMREMDVSIANILQVESMTMECKPEALTPRVIFYVLQDLSWKVEHLINRLKITCFTKEAKIGTDLLSLQSRDNIFQHISNLLPFLCKHANFMISALNSDINEQEDSQEVMYRLPTLRLIFNFISQALALFTDMGKFKQILRKLVPQGEDHTETVLADGFNFFSDYILSKKVESFDITICIFNILIMIVDKVQRGPLHYQLSQVAQHVLATNFAAAKGDICRVLQEHIIRAKEPIEVMKLYVDDYFSVFVTQPAVAPEGCPNLDKARFIYFYRTLLQETAHLLECNLLEKDTDCIFTTMNNIQASVHLFHSLVNCSHGLSVQVTAAMIKAAKEYLQEFSQRAMKFLSKHFEKNSKQVLAIVDSFKNTTQLLQQLCEDSKIHASSNKTISSQIPHVRKFIEEFFYSVKKLLRERDMLDAFELKQKATRRHTSETEASEDEPIENHGKGNKKKRIKKKVIPEGKSKRKKKHKDKEVEHEEGNESDKPPEVQEEEEEVKEKPKKIKKSQKAKKQEIKSSKNVQLEGEQPKKKKTKKNEKKDNEEKKVAQTLKKENRLNMKTSKKQEEKQIAKEGQKHAGNNISKRDKKGSPPRKATKDKPFEPPALVLESSEEEKHLPNTTRTKKPKEKRNAFVDEEAEEQEDDEGEEEEENSSLDGFIVDDEEEEEQIPNKKSKRRHKLKRLISDDEDDNDEEEKSGEEEEGKEDDEEEPAVISDLEETTNYPIVLDEESDTDTSDGGRDKAPKRFSSLLKSPNFDISYSL